MAVCQNNKKTEIAERYDRNMNIVYFCQLSHMMFVNFVIIALKWCNVVYPILTATINVAISFLLYYSLYSLYMYKKIYQI